MSALLEVTGLSRSFGEVQAVKGIDFTVAEGRCVALLGPNGAGKTTTIRMLTGLLKPTSGSIEYPGRAESADIRAGIGYLPQSPAFYPWMTGFEFVTYAGKLCGLSGAESRRSAGEWLERVGLKDAAKRRIGGYSGGMKQRLGLAQALVHGPKLLIMDEPVSALDPLGRREVLELITQLKRETTVLFSTHVLHDAEELCDDIVIIRDGRIALQGELETIRNEHRLPVIELLLEPDEVTIKWAKTFIASVDAAGEEAHRYVSRAEWRGNSMTLDVREMEGAREYLLRTLADHKVKIVRLNAGYSTLEDLFMKAVSS
ncbi:MAG: transporter ATP-binding protein [Paenibacillus sp.]|nr:transporter ATP-binding protein [Paenibacillus sp.]